MNLRHLSLLALAMALIAPVAHAQFNLDALKKQASDMAATQLNAGGIDFAAVSQQLTAAFQQASPELQKKAADLISSYTKGKDSKAGGLLASLSQAKLTPEQMKLFDAAKNDLSAALISRNFKFEESALKDLVASAVASFSADKPADGSSQLSALSKMATLTPAQKQLLADIQTAAKPVVDAAHALMAEPATPAAPAPATK